MFNIYETYAKKLEMLNSISDDKYMNKIKFSKTLKLFQETDII